MSRFLALVALAALMAFVSCEDCSKAMDTLHDCIKGSEGGPKKDGDPDHDKFKADMKDCFTKSGCKEPTFEKPADDAQHACFKAVHDKAHNLIKSCVEKKTGLTLPEKKDGGKWGKGKGKGGKGKGKGRMEEDLKTLCSTDKQREDTKTCVKALHDAKKDSHGSKDDWRAEAEKHFKEMCDKKKTCFASLSQECQQKINETKAAVCECANSEFAGAAGAQLNEEAEKCKADDKESDEDDDSGSHSKESSFTERVTRMICSKQDWCSKPFKGFGSHGKGKGKGRGGD